MPDPIAYPGQTIPAAHINSLVQPHVQALVSAFTVPTGSSTYTPVAFTGTLSGNHSGMWAPAQATRLVAPTAGVYLIHGGITWPGSLSTADARGEIRANGAGTPALGTRVGTQRGSAGNMQVTATGVVTLAAGGYIELHLNTQSGSNISAVVTLGITRISAT
ncbi:hypothetical protein GCM10010497_46150 [Streptomyces cinereoruber]|uniref:Uncharacterized protein n=1 Tax=Streptomyces cinereoruber TaxID=67260 RepID=A0AAV4KM00_9ACTN|nr:hypothetical protein [Streptomyces cinereoruber]MBB4160084.1 hypothetical protein [Streptomyces cinereoruber]MBY8818305.1 hypothetical protein [Streptomyces cinereoruber]NIH61022.1 hypothetical protein [Streptomyces cinereoruber]QEV33265.1 hypothetical protein CP977_14735 [Streptomyces cinereoruber]GGR38011.1 hypothetical protein GCM10010497_46150 [Streptomyces cinereoruber]